MPRSDGYSITAVEQVIDGWIYHSYRGYMPAGGANPAEDGCYLQHRSKMERTGLVDSIEFTLMLDVERAVGKLRETHPLSAAVLVLAMMGWTPAEIDETFRKLRTPAARHFDRGIAYCRAYLSGDDAEAAFLAGRPRELAQSGR